MSKKALSNDVYNYILDELLNDKISYNVAIVEDDYAKALGVSRTPVREALKTLEAQGLVYRLVNRGTFVKEITSVDVREIWELRKMFELQALKSSIDRVPDYEIEKGKEELRELLDNPDNLEYFHAEYSFHKLIVRYCYNKRLLGYLDNLELQIERLRRMTYSNNDTRWDVKNEHMELLEALSRRDYNETAALLEKHLDRLYTEIEMICRMKYIEG